MRRVILLAVIVLALALASIAASLEGHIRTSHLGLHAKPNPHNFRAHPMPHNFVVVRNAT